MISSLAILGAGGDTKLTWDPNDPEDCERARETVAALKSRGFVFFLTDNRPADEINGGGDGTLIVRKLAAEEVVSEPEPAAEDVASEPATGNSPPTPKRQGRPPKAKPEGQNAVAVRPMRGG